MSPLALHRGGCIIGFMPMKPNEFISNSDYLALAFISKKSFNVSFDSLQFPVSGSEMLPIIQTRDFVCPAPPGAIDSFQIEYDGERHPLATLVQPSDYIAGIFSQSWSIGAFRLDANTIRAIGAFSPPSHASVPPYCPALSFKLIVDTATAPNLT